MYHTFQTAGVSTSADNSEGGGKSGARPGPGSRRISTSNACIECRRRKIRCDGLQPCGQCQWYQHPAQCAYAKPTQRVVPSRKLLDRLQSQVDQYHAVLARLFPGKELEDFASLSRADLIKMAVTLPTLSASPADIPASHHEPSDSLERSEDADSLDALEQAPEQDPQTDETKRLRDKIQGISDDVNGLSLSVDKASSYVGVSSINAAIKVMFKTAPMARPLLAQAQLNEPYDLSRNATPPPLVCDPDPNYLPPADVGEKLIDSYFAHVHVLMPMIDEDQFRQSYLYGSRRDSPWLSLLNMVLALGSLASSTCSDEDHIQFYQRARKHMDVETFGSGSLYVLQAFALLSGYYLHWLNRPNEANGIMGATLRMATAHGLHREYKDSRRNDPSHGGDLALGNSEVPVEIRRRTWWSLYVLDSWASITTGRPSLGRTGHGITVDCPSIPEQMNNAQYLASLRLLPIIHNIPFCKIATRVQDILAERSMIGYEDLFALDAELEKWHDELPPILKDVVERPSTTKRRTSKLASRGQLDFSQPPERDKTACPEVLKTPRAIMHWRYQNLTILLHRPILLATALKRTPWANMTSDERLAVGRCRIVAGQTIADIDATCQENLIAGWNAVWMMYQAVMVHLISLFSVLSLSPDASHTENASPLRTPESDRSPNIPGSDDELERWNREIEQSIGFFDRMQRWSVAAKRSRDVVQRLYNATKHISKYNAQFHQQQLEQLQRPVAIGERNTTTADPDVFGEYPESMLRGGPNLTHYDFTQSSSAISPNLNEFWDEMMWDTFSADMPDAVNANFVEGITQTNWWQPNFEPQSWTEWPGGEDDLRQ